MTTIQTISIDITNPNITPPPRVNVKQGDSKSRTVVINILDKGVLQSSLNAPSYIYFEGINGAPPTYIVGTIVDGVLTVVIPQSALTKAGTIKAEVQITDDSDTEYILSTMNFDIFVEKAVFSEDALIGSNEGSALNKYIENHNIDSSAHEDIRQLIDNSAGKIDADSKLLTGEIFNNYTDNHALGSNSHAEGDKNTASGDNSHAEGYNNVVGGAHSHAEGSSNTIDSGTAVHVEGGKNTISANYTHAEGFNNNITAGGGYSHAEGRDNTVNGGYQHIEGRGNSSTTNELYQHIQGKFADATQTGLAHIVGNGTSATALSNAHTLDWSGNAWFGGDVFVGEQYHKLLHGESGVCTLTNSDGTVTIDGNYYVIGDLVTVWISARLSSSSDWNDTWSGLPFASKINFDGVSYTQAFDNPLCFSLKNNYSSGSVIGTSLDISNSISNGQNISFTYVKY